MKILGPHEQTKDKKLMRDVCEPIENRWRTDGRLKQTKFYKVCKNFEIFYFFDTILREKTHRDYRVLRYAFKRGDNN